MEKDKETWEIIIAGKDLNDLLDKFKKVNICHYLLFKNKTQRGALERLVINLGYDKVSKIIDLLPLSNGQPYAPVITDPCMLEKKLSNLEIWWRRKVAEKNKKGKQIIE